MHLLLSLRCWPAATRVKRSFRGLFPLLLALAGTLALGATSQAADNGLTVHDPWMRTIIPTRPAAGYFTLSNSSDKAEKLVSAASPDCGMLMLHRSVHENGQERMVMVMSVPVPAHGAVKFAPGGYHLMCMSPSKNLKPGHSVPVTLHFADGAMVKARFPVRGATGH
jgi:periplasmic copper chaperone A